MQYGNTSRMLVMSVVAMIVLQGLSFALSPAEDAGWGTPVPPTSSSDRGAGDGISPMTVTPDPYEDRFTPLMPWPTNRTFYSIQWRPGGDYALAVGSGGSLFKVTTTSITQIETATDEALYDAAWKDDGSGALIVGNNSALFTWDAVAEDLARVAIPFKQQLLGATWDPEGDAAIIVGNGGFIGRWNGTGVEPMTTGLIDWIYRIVWRPGGDYAVAVGDNGLLISVNTTEMVNSTRLDLNWGLWRLDWALDGDYALVTGLDYSFVTPRSLVVRYNATGTFDKLPVPGNLTSGLRAVDFDTVGEKAVIAGENSTVLTWDGTGLADVSAPLDRTLRGCSWVPPSAMPERVLLVVGNRGVVLRYEAGAWMNVSYDPREFNYAISWRPQGDYGLVVGQGGFMSKVSISGALTIDTGITSDLFDVDWSSDGSYALACGAGGVVVRYNNGDSQATTVRTGLLALRGIAIRPDTSEVLAVGDQGHVWYYSSGIWTDKKGIGLERNLWDVAWRPDGAFAVIVGVSGAVLNFTGTGLATLFDPQPLTNAALFSVAWDKDGTYAMAVGTRESTKQHDTIWVYNNYDWGPVGVDTGANFYGCAFTADGEVGVAFGGPDVIVKFSTLTFEGVRSSFTSPFTLPQRGCMHPTGRSVYFAGSNGYAYRMDVAEFENSPPEAVISSPRAAAVFDLGETFELSANGSWDPDGDTLGYTWVSNASGVLSTERVDHVELDDLGWHRITLYVDDGRGHNVSAFVIIRVVVPDYPPVPVINSPTEGATFTNEDLIVFDANGSFDPNGGPVTYQWVSSLSGDIGYEERVESLLRVGQHRITLWVEDAGGTRSSDSVNITVVQANRPPVVYITSPLEGERFEPGSAVELNANYSFDPDGDALAFMWADSIDGALGEGVVVSTTLSVGHHTITLVVNDGHHSVNAFVNVTVEVPPDLPPQVSISSPAPESTVKGVVKLTGLVSDPEGRPVTVSCAISLPDDWKEATVTGSTWTFDWDTTTLSNGQYSVFVEADDGVNSNRIWAQYFVDNAPVENTPPDVELVNPAPGMVKGTVRLEGLASDPDGDVIQRVEVRLGDAIWQTAVGGNAWTYEWDTTKTSNGPLKVHVRSWDGEDYSPVVEYDFTVDNPEAEPDDGFGWTLVMAVLVVAIVVAVLVWALVLRGPRQRSPR